MEGSREPIDDMDEETCEEIAEILRRKYSMFANQSFGVVEEQEPFNISAQAMQGVVVDTWLIVTGRVPLERWRDDPEDVTSA